MKHMNIEIAVLREISSAVVHEHNITALLKKVLDVLYREMGLLRGTFTLRHGDMIFIEASHGLSEEEKQKGKYHLGEGVTGLTRAVMYAGSSAAVVSLWSVSDEGTKELMIRFYEGMITKGMTGEEALRAAKRGMLADRSFHHPYFWSAFIMYGE